MLICQFKCLASFAEVKSGMFSNPVNINGTILQAGQLIWEFLRYLLSYINLTILVQIFSPRLDGHVSNTGRAERQETCGNWPPEGLLGKEEMVDTGVVWSQSM